MTNPERARRYLQASTNAGYTGLPAEHREAYEAQMAAHERAYPTVREHALAGADKDFDQRLTPGEREHQKHLRKTDGMQEADVARIRQELRSTAPRRRSTAQRPRTRSAPRRAASAGGRAATGAIGDAVAGHGNIFMQLLGWTLALSLIYLLLAGKGVTTLNGIVSTAVGGVRAFVAPVDPIKSLETALGAAAPAASSSATTTASTSAPGTSTLVPQNSAGTGGADAPAPSVAAKTATWGLPASLLSADLALRRKAAAAIAAGTETVKQAHTAEEHLIPRKRYPAFYSNQG